MVGGKFVPPTIQTCHISRLCGTIASLALDISPLNLVSFVMALSSSVNGYSLTGLYENVRKNGGSLLNKLWLSWVQELEPSLVQLIP